tara:strand:+ start:1347 stop:1859 length:513 start_codon:yes stop_codon:yes gene_type:complete
MSIVSIIKNQIKEKIDIPKNEISDMIAELEDKVRSGKDLGDIDAEIEKGEKAIDTIKNAPDKIEEGKRQIASVRKTTEGVQLAAGTVEKIQTMASSLNPIAAALGYAQKVIIDKAKGEIANLKNMEGIVDPIIDNFKDFIADQKQRLTNLKKEIKQMKRSQKLRDEKNKV